MRLISVLSAFLFPSFCALASSPTLVEPLDLYSKLVNTYVCENGIVLGLFIIPQDDTYRIITQTSETKDLLKEESERVFVNNPSKRTAFHPRTLEEANGNSSFIVQANRVGIFTTSEDVILNCRAQQ